jgi:hypothetical protein
LTLRLWVDIPLCSNYNGYNGGDAK